MTDQEHQQAMYNILFTLMRRCQDCVCDEDMTQDRPLCDCDISGSDLIAAVASFMRQLEAKGCT